MNENHNRYFIDSFKIIYVESRLIIEKKTFILMMSYRKNDVCILSIFSKYFRIFRYVCENFFEVENARTYFRDTFKQDFDNFIEYYQLFSQKKNRFDMKKTSLIDCFKRNVNYFVQKKCLIYKNFDEIKFVTLDDHVRDYFDIDDELQTFRHRQSRFIIIFATSFKSKFSTITSFVAFKIIIIVSILVVISIVVVVIDDFMNLNFAMTIVQDKSFKISKVRDICNK